MMGCLDELLKEKEKPNPESLEACYKLLTNIGDVLDTQYPKIKEEFNRDFQIVEQQTKNMNVPLRIRFLLQDVLDLRRNGWQKRSPSAPSPSLVQEPKSPQGLLFLFFEKLKRNLFFKLVFLFFLNFFFFIFLVGIGRGAAKGGKGKEEDTRKPQYKPVQSSQPNQKQPQRILQKGDSFSDKEERSSTPNPEKSTTANVITPK